VNISQLLHRKGQTHAPPETDERSLVIGRFHDAPLDARMLSPHVYPTAGQRGELDNDCLYIHHPSRRIDLESPLALRSISPNHSPELIDSLYLTGVRSTDSMTAIAFIIHLLIPKTTTDDIINIIAAQLEDTSKQWIHTSPEQLHQMITVDIMNNTYDTTFLDEEQIASGTYVTS